MADTIPSQNINNREFDKFTECPAGKTAVRVKQCEPIYSRPTGLSTGGLITEVTLNSATWTPLPALALTDRNALSIQNQSGTEIKINYDNTVPGYVGMIISPGTERFYDITDTIVIYAKSQKGTPKIAVEEIS